MGEIPPGGEGGWCDDDGYDGEVPPGGESGWYDDDEV